MPRTMAEVGRELAAVLRRQQELEEEQRELAARQRELGREAVARLTFDERRSSMGDEVAQRAWLAEHGADQTLRIVMEAGRRALRLPRPAPGESTRPVDRTVVLSALSQHVPCPGQGRCLKWHLEHVHTADGKVL
jgi:hypothetical protein